MRVLQVVRMHAKFDLQRGHHTFHGKRFASCRRRILLRLCASQLQTQKQRARSHGSQGTETKERCRPAVSRGCGNTGVENEILKSQQRSDGACPDKCGSPIGASLCAEACWSSDVVPHNEPQPRLASGLASGQSEALRCDVTVDWCREVACCAGAQGSA